MSLLIVDTSPILLISFVASKYKLIKQDEELHNTIKDDLNNKNLEIDSKNIDLIYENNFNKKLNLIRVMNIFTILFSLLIFLQFFILTRGITIIDLQKTQALDKLEINFQNDKNELLNKNNLKNNSDSETLNKKLTSDLNIMETTKYDRISMINNSSNIALFTLLKQRVKVVLISSIYILSFLLIRKTNYS